LPGRNLTDGSIVPWQGTPNNAAERQLRHFVIARRISYGTRTEVGSHSIALLASIIDTCRPPCRLFLLICSLPRQRLPWADWVGV
jgi:hypothetical protein